MRSVRRTAGYLSFFWSFLWPFLCIGLLFCTFAIAEKPEIKIGVIAPLSADMALHGVEIQRAMTLALEQSAARNRHYRYRLLFEDNQLERAKSVSAAQKLINLDKADAIVTLWPPTAEVVIPLSERSNILHYTIAWDPDLARKHRLVLSHQAMVGEIARATLRLLKQEGKARTAFLHMEESGFNMGAEAVRKLASEEGIELIADEAFNPSETDFRSLIERIRLKQPQGYLIWSVMPSMDLIIRQIRDRDPNAHLTGYFDYAVDLKPIESSRYVSEMFSTPEFQRSFLARFNSAPMSKGANAFDVMNLLIDGYESSPDRKLSGPELKKFFTSIRNRPGAVGTFSIDEAGNSSYRPVVRRIRAGKRELAPDSAQ